MRERTQVQGKMIRRMILSQVSRRFFPILLLLNLDIALHIYYFVRKNIHIQKKCTYTGSFKINIISNTLYQILPKIRGHVLSCIATKNPQNQPNQNDPNLLNQIKNFNLCIYSQMCSFGPNLLCYWHFNSHTWDLSKCFEYFPAPCMVRWLICTAKYFQANHFLFF